MKQIHMLKKLSVTVLLLTMIIFVTPVNALDMRIQPRFKIGVQYYEFEQKVITDAGSQFTTILNNTRFSDWLPLINGGTTLFIDRFFLDFNALYSFDGNSETGFGGQTFVKGGGSDGNLLVDAVFQNAGRINADFERFELSVSAGFEVLDNLVLFGGYKYAETNFSSGITGKLNTFRADDNSPLLLFSGDLVGGVNIDFNFKGPFVGVNYIWPIQQGFMNGGLSFNFAAAFLKNNTDLNFSRLGVKTVLGNVQTLDIEDGNKRNFFSREGDATGYSFGLGWQGLTPVNGLTYMMGATGYLYQFDNSETNETQVRLDFGLTYAFDFFD